LRVATVPALEAVAGLVHGFEQRPGPPDGETREAGRRRIQTALAGAGRVLFLTQVHGVAVVEAPWEGTPEADAAFAERPGLLLGIETADCLPILLVDRRRRVVAALHAGWRGTAAGVVRETVDALARRGTAPAELQAALGPAIGPCCYEVGEELRAAFGDGAGRFLSPGPRGRPHLDLRAANVDQLRSAGIPLDRIHHVPDCTRCLADLYPSYRREGPGAGRMVSYVGFSGPPS
jgi:YfiH family protein